MKLDPNISLEEFCTEMQHRVIRYSLRSLAVRQALRFARKHDNPEFYRVATNKIHAQRQFQREMNGPSFFERAFDYFSLGSLREVVVTLLLVGLAVFGIDAGRKFLNRSDRSTTFEQMDVDQLAKRLGILLEDSRGPALPTLRNPKPVQIEPVQIETIGPATEASNSPKSGISDEDVQRIVAAVLVAMQDRDKAKVAPTDTEVTQQQTSEVPGEVQAEEASPTVSLVSSEVSELPEPE